MKNIFTGWVTSTLGLVGMVLIFLHFFGIYSPPNPEFLNTWQECLIAFVACLALFATKSTFIEEQLEQFIKNRNK